MNTKSEGVKDVVKWMEEQIKAQRVNVTEAEKNLRAFGHIYDIASSYEMRLAEEKATLAQMVSWKVSTEKYMKKLRHEERDAAE
jgi:hypothetical protein